MNLDITSFLHFLRNPFKLAFCSSEKFSLTMSLLNSSVGSAMIFVRVRRHPGGMRVSCCCICFRVVDVGAVWDPARDPDGILPTDPEPEGWEKDIFNLLDTSAELEGCGSSGTGSITILGSQGKIPWVDLLATGGQLSSNEVNNSVDDKIGDSLPSFLYFRANFFLGAAL